MFRRKEESLFDTATDASHVGQIVQDSTQSLTQTQAPASSSTSASAASAPVSAPAAATSTSSYTPATAASTQAAPARPFSDPRPAQPQQQTTNVFRPAPSPLSSDLTRNRMPETKSNFVSNTQYQPQAQAGSAASTLANAAAGKPARRVLTVGHDILLKGEIATCDRLVIEGKVDATLNDVHTVEIAESGSFKGSANIEDAEISGLFEGDLNVRGLLVIRASGKVRGKISFGEVEIERGGELTGEIKIAGATGTRTRTPTKEPVAA